MDIPLISLEVTPDIATKIRLMAESGIFSIKTGNAIMNFQGGDLKSIKTELFTYQRDFSFDNNPEERVKLDK